MTLLLNLIWLICGGFVSACAWFLAGLICLVSIVLIPWAPACFRIGGFTLMPFGREAVDRRLLTGREDASTGPLGAIANILWLLVLGIPLALIHLAAAIACAVTIIGLPFALQHLKLAVLALAPFGKRIEVVQS